MSASVQLLPNEDIFKTYEAMAERLNAALPELKDSDRQEASSTAKKIRNSGFMASIPHGLISVKPTGQEIHIWNAALESPVFDMIHKNLTRSEIELEHYDPQEIAFILNYLEMPDAKRLEILKNVSDDQMATFLLAADTFGIASLRGMLEVQLLKKAPFEEETFSNIDAAFQGPAFRLINAFFFLSQILAHRASKEPYDEDVQIEAKNLILTQPVQTLCFKLTKEDAHIITKLPSSRGLKLDFSIDSSWKMSDGECDHLLEIARKTTCKHLMIDLLKIKFEQSGYATHKPGPEKFDVKDFSPDNYFPNNVRVPEPQSERYQKQKSFFQAPFPAKDVDLIVYLKNDPQNGLDIIEKLTEFNFGISLTNDTLITKKLDNVRMVSFEGDTPSIEKRLDYLAMMKRFPQCKILVLNPHWVEFFNDKSFLAQYTVWRNLTGTTKRVPGQGFAYQWVKSSSSYVQEMAHISTLTESQKRIYQLVA